MRLKAQELKAQGGFERIWSESGQLCCVVHAHLGGYVGSVERGDRYFITEPVDTLEDAISIVRKVARHGSGGYFTTKDSTG